MQRVLYLDGIRGTLAICVVLAHMIGALTGWVSPWPFEGAHLAVDMFYILSGFVLSVQLSRKSFTAWEYFWERFWRLWPLHVTTLLIALCIYEFNRQLGQYAPAEATNDPLLFLKNAFFLMKLGIFEFHIINPPSYSIGIEFWASALLVPYFVKLKPVWTLLIATTAYWFVAYRWGGLFGAPTVAPFVDLGLIKGIAGMALGCALFKLDKDISGKLASIDQSWTFAAVACSISIVGIAIYGQGNSFLNFIVIMVFSVLLMSDVMRGSGSFCQFFSSAPMVWLGNISFALYLVHTPLLVLARVPYLAEAIGDVTATIIFVIVSVLVAAALHYGVEKPVAKFVKNWRASVRKTA